MKKEIGPTTKGDCVGDCGRSGTVAAADGVDSFVLFAGVEDKEVDGLEALRSGGGERVGLPLLDTDTLLRRHCSSDSPQISLQYFKLLNVRKS